MKKIIFLFTLVLGSYILVIAQTKEATPFKARAAKVDITPKPEDFPPHITGVNDNLYVRVVVIDNGTTQAALVSTDAGVSGDGWQKYTRQIENELGIPAINIFISSSHSHSAMMGGPGNDPKMALFASNVDKAVIEAVKQAKAKLQSARIAYGAGISYLNVNRDAINPATRLWYQGPNYEGPSDKTVAVVKFETLNGEPIAVYYNYAMHPNTMFMSGVLSGDFPGMASKYIEEYYGDKMVALWSMGAAGDQNPISIRPMMDVAKFKTNAALASGKAKDEAEAIMMGSSMDVPVDPKILGRQVQMISSLDQILAEEILHVMDITQRTDTKINISADQKIITYPGRKRTNTGREGAPGIYVDGDPVNIRLSLLKIGDIAFTGIDAEIYSVIAQRLKKESSFAKTIIATTTNGMAYSVYIPSDDAFGKYTFQVLSSRLQPGHAENAIVNGLLDMMDKAK
jgi:neutral ceramidase